MVAILKHTNALSQCNQASYLNNNGANEANYYGLTLNSHFQPIYSLSHRRPIGYEGLLRLRDGQERSISPIDAFANVQSRPHLIELDRLSRYLHVKNFVQQSDSKNWLFLNVHPDVLMFGKNYGAFFGELLHSAGLKPSDIVIEILEDSIDDKGLLNETIQYYRDLGCLIAIDDFGTGNSNFDRIWKIAPDIVKLDKSIIKDAKDSAVVRRMLPNLVSLIHECGSLVLMEGVEEEEQALMAVDSGADFVQGYYLARPAPYLVNGSSSDSLGRGGLDLSHLCSAYQGKVTRRNKNTNKVLSIYTDAFREVSSAITSGDEISSHIESLLSLSGVERCYMLDKKGRQIGSNYLPDEHAEVFPQRFAVLEDQCNASWFRRAYFRRAITEPDTIHVSRPYLSMTAGIVCITLSIMVKDDNGNNVVLCCDIDWSDRD